MEIRNLKTFLHVAALQNVTKAAAELGYSQSAVSVQIRQLEQEIGLPLFDRIGKNVALTDYGRSLLPYARSAVTAVAEVEHFGKPDHVLGGRLRIGITDSLFEQLSEELLLNYHRRFPRVSLELLVDTTVNLTRQLQQGSIDAMCVIDDPLPPGQWRIWRQVEVPIVVAVGLKHPLAGRESVSLAELEGSELVMMENDAPYSRRFETLLAQQQVDCSIFLRMPSAGAARKLLLDSDFASVLPLYTVRQDAAAGRLCLLPLQEWQLTQSVQMVLHRSKVVMPPLEGLLTDLSRALTDTLLEGTCQTEKDVLE